MTLEELKEELEGETLELKYIDGLLMDYTEDYRTDAIKALKHTYSLDKIHDVSYQLDDYSWINVVLKIDNLENLKYETMVKVLELETI